MVAVDASILLVDSPSHVVLRRIFSPEDRRQLGVNRCCQLTNQKTHASTTQAKRGCPLDNAGLPKFFLIEYCVNMRFCSDGKRKLWNTGMPVLKVLKLFTLSVVIIMKFLDWNICMPMISEPRLI